MRSGRSNRWIRSVYINTMWSIKNRNGRGRNYRYWGKR